MSPWDSIVSGGAVLSFLWIFPEPQANQPFSSLPAVLPVLLQLQVLFPLPISLFFASAFLPA